MAADCPPQDYTACGLRIRSAPRVASQEAELRASVRTDARTGACRRGPPGRGRRRIRSARPLARAWEETAGGVSGGHIYVVIAEFVSKFLVLGRAPSHPRAAHDGDGRLGPRPLGRRRHRRFRLVRGGGIVSLLMFSLSWGMENRTVACRQLQDDNHHDNGDDFKTDEQPVPAGRTQCPAGFTRDPGHLRHVGSRSLCGAATRCGHGLSRGSAHRRHTRA